MDIFGQGGEVVIIVVLVIGVIFASLMILSVLFDVYKNALTCVKDKLKKFLTSSGIG